MNYILKLQRDTLVNKMAGMLDDLRTSLSGMQFGEDMAHADTDDITNASSAYAYLEAYFQFQSTSKHSKTTVVPSAPVTPWS